jgi:hypothetical protein
MFNDANISEIISNYVKITDNGNRVENYLGDMLIKPFNLGDSYFIEISLAYFISIRKYAEYLNSINIIG